MEHHARELEDFLRGAIEAGDRSRRWERDYSSVDRYKASVGAQREAWQRSLLGEQPLEEVAGQLVVADWLQHDGVRVQRVRVGARPGLTASGLLLTPAETEGPLPLVVCVHGMQGSPENVAGIVDPTGIYHQFGQRLVKRGYAVLAPKNVSGIADRVRLHRLATLLGSTLVGLDIRKIQLLLDALVDHPDVDAGRIGMHGISQGGLTTLYMAPIEPRIRCAVVTAYFNKRAPKMITSSDKYQSFLDSDEEDKFIPGLLPCFSDSDLVSLACPRPLLVEAGRNDRSIYWPDVLEEFGLARDHYQRLGVGDRIELDLHDGGHEIHGVSSLEFLDKWLRRESV